MTKRWISSLSLVFALSGCAGEPAERDTPLSPDAFGVKDTPVAQITSETCIGALELATIATSAIGALGTSNEIDGVYSWDALACLGPTPKMERVYEQWLSGGQTYTWDDQRAGWQPGFPEYTLESSHVLESLNRIMQALDNPQVYYPICTQETEVTGGQFITRHQIDYLDDFPEGGDPDPEDCWQSGSFVPCTFVLEIACPAPPAPGNLEAAAIVGVVGLDWDAPSLACDAIDHYEIERQNFPSGSPVTFTTTATSYVDATVVAGTMYKYRVRVIAESGNTGAWTSWKKVRAASGGIG